MIQTATPKKVLIVDDDETIGDLIRLVLSEEAMYDTYLATNPYQALELASTHTFDLFILDYRLTYFDGFTLYDRLHTIDRYRDVPAIMISSSIRQQEKALKKRNLIGIGKPFDMDMLLNTVHNVIDNQVVQSRR
ncbi:MAG TPA: response regulator [Ktedonobacteraceae bacterium]|nr:response regulator [Ktedonobacteraceae bacterium]